MPLRTDEIQGYIDGLVCSAAQSFDAYATDPVTKKFQVKRARRLIQQADHLKQSFPITRRETMGFLQHTNL